MLNCLIQSRINNRAEADGKDDNTDNQVMCKLLLMQEGKLGVAEPIETIKSKVLPKASASSILLPTSAGKVCRLPVLIFLLPALTLARAQRKPISNACTHATKYGARK